MKTRTNFSIRLFVLACVVGVFAGFTCSAQNLVPNPSFEEYTVCPNDLYMLPTDWYTCSGDPDYFNACDTIGYMDFSVPQNSFGYQVAADGNAYCGFYSLCNPSYPAPYPYKEYLGCHLVSPLIIGEKYFVSFRINFADHPGIYMATNNIGLLFSTISYRDYQPYDSLWGIPTNNFAHVFDTTIITDSQNWTVIKGTIIADSAYQYLLIGNFFDMDHIDTILYHNPIWLNQIAYYFLDMVCVSTDSLTCNSPVEIQELNYNNEVTVYPDPVRSLLHISVENIKNYYLKVFDPRGALIIQSDKLKNNIDIDISKYPKGIYFIQILSSNKIFTKKFIIN